MKMSTTSLAVFSLGLVLVGAACGSDENNNGLTPPADSGATNSNPNGEVSPKGEARTAGSCNLADSGFCITYECVGETECENYVIAGPTSCEDPMLGGVWSTAACSTVNSLGTCRDPNPYGGDTITTYYPGMLSAESVKSMCESQGNIYSAP
jgi:hypothetical protein